LKLIFSEEAWEDYLYWQQADKKTLKRINLLIREIQRSRRITDEHRIVYKSEEDAVLIAQLRYHY
jgi:toxin YoeB